ncbi:1450_t:CDS:10, partial [Diversispora eburnea]
MAANFGFGGGTHSEQGGQNSTPSIFGQTDASGFRAWQNPSTSTFGSTPTQQGTLFNKSDTTPQIGGGGGTGPFGNLGSSSGSTASAATSSLGGFSTTATPTLGSVFPKTTIDTNNNNNTTSGSSLFGDKPGGGGGGGSTGFFGGFKTSTATTSTATTSTATASFSSFNQTDANQKSQPTLGFGKSTNTQSTSLFSSAPFGGLGAFAFTSFSASSAAPSSNNTLGGILNQNSTTVTNKFDTLKTSLPSGGQSLFSQSTVQNRSSDVNIPKTSMPTITTPFGSTASSTLGQRSLGNSLQSTTTTKSTAPIQLNKPSNNISIPATSKPLVTIQSTTPARVPDQIPSWLKNNTIETIINKWSKDLENCSKKFMEQVREINQWDQKIIENNGRGELDIGLTTIEARQEELEKLLLEYEQKFADPAFESMKPLDREREKSYSLAESINQDLDNMNQTLSDMITDMNRSTTSSTYGPLVRILNSHLTSLQWIDTTANQLSARVQEAQSFIELATNKMQGEMNNGV